MPSNVTASEMLRLNMSIAPCTSGCSAFGVIGGDLAGFPNGRPLSDDIIDVSLRVVLGVLLPTHEPIADTIGDGANANDVASCIAPVVSSAALTAPARVGWPAVQARVVMYSRPDCGLCDEARQAILVERTRTAFNFREVDISGDDALELEYGIRVPVVVVDGEELFEVRVNPADFARAVRR